MGNVDTKFSGEIFRKNHPQILACRRDLALLLPVRMRYKAGGYAYGTIVAKNTTDGLFDAYASGGSSGTNVAAAVLQNDINFDGTDTNSQIAVGIFKGNVWKAQLTGYAAGVLTDLKARVLTDSSGMDDILSF